MSNLDDRLSAIILRIYYAGYEDTDLEKGYPDDEYLAQIHKAFADEGYVKVPQVELNTPNYNGYKPKAEIFTVNGKEVMSGQAWLDRFDELMSKMYDTWNDGGNSFVERKLVMEAAKRAAGIDKEER